jgi:hypothetical protein
LDFGSNVFNGNAKWLEISVRPGDSNDVNDYVTLNPRQEVTSTPYSLHTRGIFVDNAENVGIGTINPTGKLHVDGGKAVDNMDGNGIMIKAQDGGNTTQYSGRSGGDIILLPGKGGLGGLGGLGLPGKVGIGTEEPEVMLDVRGDIQVDQKIQAYDSGGLELATDEGTTRIFVADDGKVGMGTNAPRASLEVTNSGSSHAIWASTSDIPIYAHRTGTSGTWPAVNGDCNSESSGASGVRGRILSTSPGSLSAGVYGYNYGTGSNGVGVRGYHSGSGAGVYGHSNSGGKGVCGYAGGTDGTGIYGEHSGGNYGSLGGFYYGASGFNDGGYGVYGESNSGTGVRGFSASGTGVNGHSGSSHGVYGYSQSGYGVHGYSLSNYAGYFGGNVYVSKNVSAESFTDRTPYPKDLTMAYEAVMSMERLPDGQYNEDNKEVQLDHSMLSDFVRSKDGNRDLSATVSCHNEVLKDLISKQQELSKANTYIEQLQKQNELLKERLVKLEVMITKLNAQ